MLLGCCSLGLQLFSGFANTLLFTLILGPRVDIINSIIYHYFLLMISLCAFEILTLHNYYIHCYQSTSARGTAVGFVRCTHPPLTL